MTSLWFIVAFTLLGALVGGFIEVALWIVTNCPRWVFFAYAGLIIGLATSVCDMASKAKI